jgi:UDP-N-acetylglucosamine:LPS N-acetylglucosamine transferase
MFERVLILSVDIGGGHVRAAQALQKVFARLEAAREVRIADAMQYTSKLFWRLFERAYRDIVVNPIKGQEEHNADHLLEEGVAIRCHNLLVLAYKVDRLLHDPKRLARMQARARRLSRPYAAFDIVRKLLQLQRAALCSREGARPAPVRG